MERGEFVHEKRSNWVIGGSAPPGAARPEDFSTSWEERVASSAHCHLDCGDESLLPPAAWIPPAIALAAEHRPMHRRAASRLRQLIRDGIGHH
jgi:hypothetical protein